MGNEGRIWDRSWRRKFLFLSTSFGIRRELFYPNDPNWADERFIQSLQTSLNIYYNGLGSNLLDKFKKVKIDLVISPIWTLGVDSYRPQSTGETIITVQPFHSLQATTIEDPFKSSLSLGANFIFNNYNRNQRTGFFNINGGRSIVIGYYNDGAPFHVLLTGDRFDRYWTGGGFAELYFRPLTYGDLDSKWGFYHDRYTGDVQDVYNASNFFGFEEVYAKNIIENLLNRTRSKVAFYNFNNNFEFSIQKLGKVGFDIQDEIHNFLGMTKHVTYDKAHLLIGSQYSNTFKINHQ